MLCTVVSFLGLRNVSKKHSCIETVSAKYVSQVRYYGGSRVSLYSVKMQYTYKGINIVFNSLDLFTISRIQTYFNKESKYFIKINPSNPREFFFKNQSIGDAILMFVGFLIIVFSFKFL